MNTRRNYIGEGAHVAPSTFTWPFASAFRFMFEREEPTKHFRLVPYGPDWIVEIRDAEGRIEGYL